MYHARRASALTIGAAIIACAPRGATTSPPVPRGPATAAAPATTTPPVTIAVAYVNLGDPADTIYTIADSVFHAASTMKLPVMMRLYREHDAGHLDLDSKVLVTNRFASIVDGSPYSLDPGDDSDSSMYARVGDSVTVRDLIEHMITRSSNLATNMLIDLANPDSTNAMMRSLGATHMRVLRGVEDIKAFDRGLNNTATARDLAILLVALETGKAASPASTTAMRRTLLAQQLNEKIPAGLPPGTPVAHKTGSITGISHDAAIVYPRGHAPYVLVVLTRGFRDERSADSAIAAISRRFYEHATGKE